MPVTGAPHPPTGRLRLVLRMPVALNEEQAGEQMPDYAGRHRLAARELCRIMGNAGGRQPRGLRSHRPAHPMLRLTPMSPAR